MYIPKNVYCSITYSWPQDLEMVLDLSQRGRTTNGEIGPVADQIYEIWIRTHFVI